MSDFVVPSNPGSIANAQQSTATKLVRPPYSSDIEIPLTDTNDLGISANPILRNEQDNILQAKAIAAAHNIPLVDAYKTREAFQEYYTNLGYGKIVANNLHAGTGATYRAIGSAMDYLGLDGSPYSQFGAKLESAWIPDQRPEDFHWSDLVNPEWMATTGVRNTPMMLSLIVPTILGGMAGGTAGTLITGSKFVGTVLGALGGGAAGTHLESAMEAGGAVQEALAKGMSPEEAQKVGDEVYKANIYLLGAANVVSGALLFSPWAKAIRGPLGRAINTKRIASATGAITGSAAVEGFQERTQEYFTAKALGEDKQWWDSSFSQAQALGMLFGGGSAAVSNAAAITSDMFTRTAENPLVSILVDGEVKGNFTPPVMEEEVTNLYHDILDKAVQAGLKGKELTYAALGELSKTDIGKKHVETVTKWMVETVKDFGKQPVRGSKMEQDFGIGSLTEERVSELRQDMPVDLPSLENKIQELNWAETAQIFHDLATPEVRAVTSKAMSVLGSLQESGVAITIQTLPSDPASPAPGITSIDSDGNVTITLYSPTNIDGTPAVVHGLTPETFTHELLHGALHGAISHGLKAENRYAKTGKLASRLTDILKSARDAFAQQKGANTPLGKAGQLLENSNVLSSEHELLSWGLTNADVREFLSTVKVPGEARSLWGKIVLAIKDFFGFTPEEEAALDALLGVSDELLKTEAIIAREPATYAQDYSARDEQDAIDMLRDEERRISDAVLETLSPSKQIKAIAEQRKLKNVDELRKILKLPSAAKMTPDQFQSFKELVLQYKPETVFLPYEEFIMLRQSLADRTDNPLLTYEELRSYFEPNLEGSELAPDLPINILRVLPDTFLRNHGSILQYFADALTSTDIVSARVFYSKEQVVRTIAKAAHKSRERTIWDRLVPTNDLVVTWLETPPDERDSLTAQMTPEELRLAEYLENEFGDYKLRLIESGALTKGQEFYLPHVMRSLLEGIKEEGLVAGVKQYFNDYAEMDRIVDVEQFSNMPTTQFFRYLMHRDGTGKYSTNVVRSYLLYVRGIERKLAMDAVLPQLYGIVSAFSEKAYYREESAVLDHNSIQFIKEYVENKQGKQIDFLTRQGSKVTLLARALRTFVTLLDLGFNLVPGIASFAGESITTFVGIGPAAYAKGAQRLATPEGRAFISAHQDYIGREPLEEMLAPEKDILDRVYSMALLAFSESAALHNKIYLLGMVSDTEYNAGKINDERLTEMRLDMARWRNIPSTASVAGSTEIGRHIKMYRSWAYPPLITTTRNIRAFAQVLRNKGVNEALTMREGVELMRITYTATAIVLLFSLMRDNDDKSTWKGRMLNRLEQEFLTIVQSTNPAIWMSVPRTQTYVQELGRSLSAIVGIHQYGYVRPLSASFTPRIVHQVANSLFPEDKK